MTINEVKKTLGRRVAFRGAEYILTGCIIRRDSLDGSFFYQAELTDVTFDRSIVICRLDEIEGVQDDKSL